jgi:membrane protease YdiL (CAAX protease family)
MRSARCRYRRKGVKTHQDRCPSRFRITSHLTSTVKAVGAVALRILALLIVWGMLLVPFFVLRGGFGSSQESITPLDRLYLETASVLTLLIALWLMLRFVDHRPFRSIGFKASRLISETGLGLLLGTAMLGLALLLVWVGGWLGVVGGSGSPGSPVLLLGVALFANAVTQEVTVRGYVLQTIEDKFGWWKALLWSSIFFVALHGGMLAEGAILPVANLFLAGVLFGLAYLVTRNLWLPIAAHFAWNFLLGPVLGLTVTGQSLDGGWEPLSLGGPALFTGGDFGIEGGLAATLAVGAGCVVLWLRRPADGRRSAE